MCGALQAHRRRRYNGVAVRACHLLVRRGANLSIGAALAAGLARVNSCHEHAYNRHLVTSLPDRLFACRLSFPLMQQLHPLLLPLLPPPPPPCWLYLPLPRESLRETQPWPASMGELHPFSRRNLGLGHHACNIAGVWSASLPARRMYQNRASSCCMEARFILDCDEPSPAPCRGFTGDCAGAQAPNLRRDLRSDLKSDLRSDLPSPEP